MPDSIEESEEASASDRESARESLEKSDYDSDGPTFKRLRIQKPDVTVIVGSGHAEESFECYSVVLCFASEVFDVMLSTEMKEKNSCEVRLPDKEPSEWKLFYKFIDPVSLADPELHMVDWLSYDRCKNVETMLPWFQEFGMEKWLHKCDDLLSSHISRTLSRMMCNIQSKTCSAFKEVLTMIFQGLKETNLYRLPLTEKILFSNLATAFKERGEDIDEDVITKLEEFVHLDGFKKYSWNSIKTILPKKVQEKDPKDLFKNELFASLLMSRIEIAKAKPAKEEVNTALPANEQETPQFIYEEAGNLRRCHLRFTI